MSVKLSSLLPLRIKTSRLTLEQYDSSDAHVRCCLEARNSPVTYAQSGDQGCYDKENLEWRHNVGRIAREEFGGLDVDVDVFIWYVIRVDVDVSEEDQSAPFIGFVAIHQRDESAPELGYNIIPKFMGRGYATEAVIRISQFARETLRMRRLAASIKATNISSLRVAEKAGFVSRGRTKVMDDGSELNCYELKIHDS